MMYGIRTKLLVYSMVIVLLVSVSISVFSMVTNEIRVRAQFEEEALRHSSLIAETLAPSLTRPDTAAITKRLRSARLHADVTRSVVFDRDGHVIADGSAENLLQGRRLSGPIVKSIVTAHRWFSENNGQVLWVGGPILSPDGQPLAQLHLEFSLAGLNDRHVRQ